MFEDCRRRGREENIKTHIHTHATARRMGWQEGKREEKGKRDEERRKESHSGRDFIVGFAGNSPNASRIELVLRSQMLRWRTRSVSQPLLTDDEGMNSSLLHDRLSIFSPLQTRCKASEYCNLEAEAKPRPQPHLNKLYSRDRPLTSPPSHPPPTPLSGFALLARGSCPFSGSMHSCLLLKLFSFLKKQTNQTLEETHCM